MVVGQIAESTDFVVAGAGPGGYVAALRAALGALAPIGAFAATSATSSPTFAAAA